MIEDLPEVTTARSIVNPESWLLLVPLLTFEATFLLRFSGITRFKGGRWDFFRRGGLAAVLTRLNSAAELVVHEVCVAMLLLVLLFCSTIVVGAGGDGLNPAMALVMVEAANIEAWWAGGGHMGCWIDRTALAAEIEPMVDRCEAADSAVAAAAVVSLSSWLLLVSSDQWVFEVNDFLAKKQRGISFTQYFFYYNLEMGVWVCRAFFPNTYGYGGAPNQGPD